MGLVVDPNGEHGILVKQFVGDGHLSNLPTAANSVLVSTVLDPGATSVEFSYRVGSFERIDGFISAVVAETSKLLISSPWVHNSKRFRKQAQSPSRYLSPTHF